MKKRLFRALSSKVLAAAVGAAVLIQAQGPVLAGAVEEVPLYISEVYLSYGKTAAEAKQWLERNGYKVLDQDLNEDADGFMSTKRSVYLGYKTTTDKDEAITDMRAMNMNGNFSYEAYEKLLEERKSDIKNFIGSLVTALKEYRANYEAGKPKALIAHENMNKYYDDDSEGALMGDLLLKPIKEEMPEEKFKAAEKEHADMTTVLLQGNLDIVRDIMANLAYAADTSESSWLERLGSVSFDGFYESYQNEYPSLSESQIDSLIIADNDDDARAFLDCLSEIRNAKKYADEVGLPFDASEEDVKAYFDEHTDKSSMTWASAAIILTDIQDITYEGESLVSIAVSEEYDFEDINDRMFLYPIVNCLSAGQRAMLRYTDFCNMIISGSFNDEEWNDAHESVKKANAGAHKCSVYSGILREAFEPGGVALTSEARNYQSATGNTIDEGLFSSGLSVSPFIGIGTGILFVIGGVAAYKYGSGVVSTQINAQNRINELVNDYKFNVDPKLHEKAKAAREALLKTDPTNDTLLNKFYSNGGDEYFEQLSSDAREIVDEYYKNDVDYQDLVEKSKKILVERDKNEELIDAAINNNAINADDADSFEYTVRSYKSDKMRTLGKALCIAGVIIAVASAAYAVYEMYQYYHQDMQPVPRIIVSESSDEKGRAAYTYYSCTKCNRAAQGFANDEMGDHGDMNGDVGKQWLALYTTKDKAAGEEITADIIAQKGSNRFPVDKGTSIRLFGQNDSLNIVSEEYGYNDGLKGLYIFSGTASINSAPAAPAVTPAAETASETETPSSAETSASADSSDGTAAAATGSVVGTGTMMLSCVGSAALGALVCFLIVRTRRKDSAA